MLVHSEPTITVPLRFHIVADLTMHKNGQEMNSWVGEHDIKLAILPEVNRIWQQAGIAFSIEKILKAPALNPPHKKRLIDYVVDAKRDSDGNSDAKRIKKLNKLINWEEHNPNAINIYLIPYLGETSQGNAKPNFKRIFVGQWSDKPTKGKNTPERFQLTESGVFKIGSLSRTVAHEIGHILGLKHPDKRTQKNFDLLMGGKKAGYQLTGEEIETAREQASILGHS